MGRRLGSALLLAITFVMVVCGAGSAYGADVPRDVVQDFSAAAAGSPQTAIAEGSGHTCALTNAGGVKCWGRNNLGQLGDGTTTGRLSPVDVYGLTSGVSAISAGLDHTCALTSAGGVKCWGANGSGQLGDGTTTDRLTPVDVFELASGVGAITAGDWHACAVTSAGGVKCWGANAFGRLGDGTTVRRLTPVDVFGLTSGVSAITAGSYHTCAVTTADGVKCWGQNNRGQLGNGTTASPYLKPVNVAGLVGGVSAISADFDHTCALTSAGGIKCWGNNWAGQLGDGTTTDRLTPVDVSELTGGVSAISTGTRYTCALTAAGGVKCWGGNGSGRLGDGTTTDRLTPVDVSELTSGVSAISAGYNHTCALTTAGGIKCWGNNGSGQLGDGTTTSRQIPVDVIGFEGANVDLLLAQQYAPIVRMHEDDKMVPMSVDLALEHAICLKRQPGLSAECEANAPITTATLESANWRNEQDAYIDFWGNPNSSAADGSLQYYENEIWPGLQFAPVVYARVTPVQPNGRRVIQYWIYYYYNNWWNKHEGDWEMVQVVLGTNGTPEYVAYAQHDRVELDNLPINSTLFEGGSRREWDDVAKESDHPIVYPGKGSHASYFHPGKYIVGLDEAAPGVADAVEHIPTVKLITVATTPWVQFMGHWGEKDWRFTFSGPGSPALQGDPAGLKWDTPLQWSDALPYDEAAGHNLGKPRITSLINCNVGIENIDNGQKWGWFGDTAYDEINFVESISNETRQLVTTILHGDVGQPQEKYRIQWDSCGIPFAMMESQNSPDSSPALGTVEFVNGAGDLVTLTYDLPEAWDSSTSVGSIVIAPESNYVLEVDVDGDGTTELVAPPSEVEITPLIPNSPINPNPTDGATGVATDAVLSWQATDPDDTLTYEVRLDTTNPPPSVATGQSATTYNPPGGLDPDTTYYWQIVATDDGGLSTEGPVWSFTTAYAPNLYSISGNVSEDIGFPLEGALITDSSGAETYSDEYGDYVLSGLQAGIHEVEVFYNDFVFANNPRTVTLPPDATEVDFTGTFVGLNVLITDTIADAYVDESAKGKNFGTKAYLRVRDTAKDNRAYLTFDVSGLSCAVIESVSLSLFAQDPGSDGGTVYRVDSSWTEKGIKWNNAPPLTGGALGDFGAVADEAWTTATLAADAVTGDGVYSFAIAGGDADLIEYASREGVNPAKLQISYRIPASAAPVAGFSAAPDAGYAPLEVSFTDTSTNCPDTWSWDFGDGTTSNEQHPTHTYAAPGTYTVSLTAGNGAGSDTVTRTGYITVEAAPFPNLFYISPANNKTIGGMKTTSADILRYNKAADSWTMIYDGSERNTPKNISAFHIMDDGSLLLVFAGNQNIAGLGKATPYDVVKFTPNNPGSFPLGPGTYTWFFQGKQYGLSAGAEKIDALDYVGNRLLLSTTGTANVTLPNGTSFKPTKEDVFTFNRSTNQWESTPVIDGSTIPELKGKNISSVWDDPNSGDYYVTVTGAFKIGGVKGNAKSIVKLTPNGSDSFTPSFVDWLAPGVKFLANLDGLDISQ